MEAAGLLFTIEKEGQTAVAELIPYIGGLEKLSHDLGISQDEMAAALALGTQTTGDTCAPGLDEAERGHERNAQGHGL